MSDGEGDVRAFLGAQPDPLPRGLVHRIIRRIARELVAVFIRIMDLGRRFGAVLWTEDDPYAHKLLTDLGPEPLEATFSGDHLHRLSRGRTRATSRNS